ncbi:hypothetical protein [Halomarina litorea]|uniref:hypothetical protein n=1 Tax=Halomarina litorea TaxID=2961595 RepID=UPI0020C5A0D4|nr:hypothetical protein [Halomarina sp. BCD28]
MSTETATPDRTAAERPSLPSLLARARATLARGVTALSFWLAVVLPLVYLPLLLAGIETPQRGALVGGLLLANAGTLLLGHTHRRD